MTMYKSIGVTGTRLGLSKFQLLWLEKFLTYNKSKVLHHGDCVGVDTQVAIQFAKVDAYIIAHPGNIKNMQANCVVNDLIMPWSDTLVRNRFIVNHSSLLLAFPATTHQIAHSGTWSTIRYAKKQSKPVLIISPDGDEV